MVSTSTSSSRTVPSSVSSVEQGGDDGRSVQPVGGQVGSHCHRVGNKKLAGLTALVAMFPTSEIVRFLDLKAVSLRKVSVNQRK